MRCFQNDDLLIIVIWKMIVNAIKKTYKHQFSRAVHSHIAKIFQVLRSPKPMNFWRFEWRSIIQFHFGHVQIFANLVSCNPSHFSNLILKPLVLFGHSSFTSFPSLVSVWMTTFWLSCFDVCFSIWKEEVRWIIWKWAQRDRLDWVGAVVMLYLSSIVKYGFVRDIPGRSENAVPMNANARNAFPMSYFT